MNPELTLLASPAGPARLQRAYGSTFASINSLPCEPWT